MLAHASQRVIFWQGFFCFALTACPQLKHYPLPIIGGRDCDKVTKTPAHGETFSVGNNIRVKALHTPCHTQDSICFLFEDGDDRAVFTGDTLFIGGAYDVMPRPCFPE